MRKLFILLLSLATTAAAAPATNPTDLDRLAADYYASQRFSRPLHAPEECNNPGNPGNGPSCADVACNLIGAFGCDELSQVERVGRACRGNYDGTCLAKSCRRLGSFGCDELSEVERVAASCRGVYSGDCADAVCNRLGTFGCDELSEVERVGRMCRATDARCIESVCNRLGVFGCDELSELERVANSCSGN